MKKYSNGRQVTEHFVALYGKKNFAQLARYDKLICKFKRKFKSNYCYLASSSGRVELVGNHTDHNGGKVVGCTVDLDIVAAFLPNETNRVVVCGNNYKDIVINLADIETVEGGSTGMVKGVLVALKNSGYKIGGFTALLNSTVPSGAGLSSSAAFQLLIGAIVNALYNNDEIPAQTLASAGQYAENVYFNKPCGLLDQGVIAVGGVVGIDFSSGFSKTKLGTDLLGVKLVVVDTGKSHSGLTEHYAAIPREMKAVAQLFDKQRLIDLDETEFFNNFDAIKQQVGERAVLRAKHFFEENHRVEQFSKALSTGNKQSLLDAVSASGDSSIYQLQNCEVNGDETLKDAVLFARNICPSCASRVHGGGFQGTILALLDDDVAKFQTEMAKRYGKNKVHVLRVRSVGATVL